eukprot:192368_1
MSTLLLQETDNHAQNDEEFEMKYPCGDDDIAIHMHAGNSTINTDEYILETKEEIDIISIFTGKTDNLKQICEFKKPQNSDFTTCNNEEHDVSKCDVVQRIVHMLNYYDQQQRKTSNIYEYLSSLTKYDLATFMDDWYLTKNNHLVMESHMDWMRTNVSNIHCNNKSCDYIRRYTRDRDQDIDPFGEHIDYKNMILIDKLASIHTYIFHSQGRRNEYKEPENCKEPENSNEQISSAKFEENEMKDVWINKPQSIQQCNLQQMVCILEHVIHNKLIDYKSDIVNYMKQNELDGNKFCGMKRKAFINEFSAYLDNKKLRGVLGSLFNDIKKCHLSVFTGVDSKEEIKNKLKGKKSKFVTKITSENEKNSKDQFYSFGVQYKYTQNLTEHPWYVKPKYESLKEELTEYFRRKFAENDLLQLLESQLEPLSTIKVSLQPILKQLLRNEMNISADDTNKNALWKYITDQADECVELVEQKYNELSIACVKIVNSSQSLQQIVNKLCAYMDEEKIKKIIYEERRDFILQIVNNMLRMQDFEKCLSLWTDSKIDNLLNSISEYIQFKNNHLLNSIGEYIRLKNNKHLKNIVDNLLNIFKVIFRNDEPFDVNEERSGTAQIRSQIKKKVNLITTLVDQQYESKKELLLNLCRELTKSTNIYPNVRHGVYNVEQKNKIDEKELYHRIDEGFIMNEDELMNMNIEKFEKLLIDSDLESKNSIIKVGNRLQMQDFEKCLSLWTDSKIDNLLNSISEYIQFKNNHLLNSIGEYIRLKNNKHLKNIVDNLLNIFKVIFRNDEPFDVNEERSGTA